MTSMLDQILNALPIIGVIAFLGIMMYVFYTNQKARKILGSLFPLLPYLLEFLANRLPDKQGVFDTHDMAALSSRVLRKLNMIVRDPSNLVFGDVEEEIKDLVSEELSKYQAAGVKGVPDLSSEQVVQQVHIIFTMLKSLAEHTEDVGSDQ